MTCSTPSASAVAGPVQENRLQTGRSLGGEPRRQHGQTGIPEQLAEIKFVAKI
jgi:hypothetical protein